MFKSMLGKRIADNIRHLLPLICLVIPTIIGCSVTTKPNISAIYHIPELRDKLPQMLNIKALDKKELAYKTKNSFINLYRLDPGVAIEVGKLPEFQDDIGDLQEISLARFVDLLAKASTEEKENLRKFLNVGKPAIRRFCSPLQAIFWLLEKGEYDPSESPLKYDLDTLLTKSWSLNYLERGEDTKRWKDYGVVIDRLNDPYLINFYEQKKFIYNFSRMRGDWSSNPYGLFKTKQGDCLDIAAFTVICLKNAGYPAREYDVGHIPGGYGSTHIVTLFEMDGKKYIMDNGLMIPQGIMLFETYRPY